MVALLLGTAAPGAANELTLAFQNGRVTLVAEQVTVREILEAWARVGSTRIVNLDKLVGPPVSLRLEAVPEADALTTILRSASGFVAAPRRGGDAGASRFDRILILAASRAPTVPASTPPAAPTPAVRPVLPFPTPPGAIPEPEGESESPGGGPAASPARPISPFVPGPALTNPGEMPPFGLQPEAPDPSPAETPATPQGPQTVPRPGMIVAPPQAPSPGNRPPGLPPDPRRPPSNR